MSSTVRRVSTNIVRILLLAAENVQLFLHLGEPNFFINSLFIIAIRLTPRSNSLYAAGILRSASSFPLEQTARRN